jgi:hypothetical protein
VMLVKAPAFERASKFKSKPTSRASVKPASGGRRLPR